jgi:predicted RNA binding protein YcfA (HicA-like mRNA interferase family)
VRLLERSGFINVGGANHDRFEHADGRRTEVPRHAEINKWLFERIKRQAGLR